jgi:hypothetical protein
MLLQLCWLEQVLMAHVWPSHVCIGFIMTVLVFSGIMLIFHALVMWSGGFTHGTFYLALLPGFLMHHNCK